MGAPSECAVDLSDKHSARIATSAGRLARLLAHPRVLGDPNTCACLDDLLGAVHGLYMARLLGFEDRPDKPIELPVLRKRAEDLSKGNVRTVGKWAAGFYFNGALFRIAGVYHRVLKVVLGKPETRAYIPALRGEIILKYRQWTAREWEGQKISLIHREVNTLKHAARGVYMSRTVRFDDGVAALEELLELIEGWMAQSAPPAPVPAV